MKRTVPSLMDFSVGRFVVPPMAVPGCEVLLLVVVVVAEVVGLLLLLLRPLTTATGAIEEGDIALGV